MSSALAYAIPTGMDAVVFGRRRRTVNEQRDRGLTKHGRKKTKPKKPGKQIDVDLTMVPGFNKVARLFTEPSSDVPKITSFRQLRELAHKPSQLEPYVGKEFAPAFAKAIEKKWRKMTEAFMKQANGIPVVQKWKRAGGNFIWHMVPETL